MGNLWKKSDPIQEQAKKLDRQIAELENKIKQLASEPVKGSLAGPKAPTTSAARNPYRKTGSLAPEPAFEDLNQQKVVNPMIDSNSPAHYNEFGVRKFDILAAWRKLTNHLHGPTSTNPQLVNFLAAGSLKGLRPLRYEKRVARNRFLAFFSALLLVLYGLIYFFMRTR